jgi:TolB-like protein
MKRTICAALALLFTITGALFAQTNKDNLAILPFTGGAGDEGDAIAELLSFDPQLTARFGIMPRTGIANAIAKEQGFQTKSGMTDADTIAALGEQLGAQYVMAGSITALGNLKLLVVTIVRIETIQQVAGTFLTYSKIENLPATFSDMMKTLLPMVDVNTSGLQKLAVLPIQMQGGATNTRDASDADTLAQILAISLLRNKSYAIYPRTSSLEKVQAEFKMQNDGRTADKNAAQLGYGVNPEYVLSVASRKLGELNMFNASIIDLAAGTQLEGMSEQYGTLTDGMAAMEIIAKGLSGGEISDKERQRRGRAISSSTSAADREEAARIAAEKRDKFLRESGIVFGIQGGISTISNKTDQIFGTSSSTVQSAETESIDGYSVSPIVALRIGHFAIQSGATVNINFKGPSNLTYSFVQVPALVRGDWHWGDEALGLGFGVFGGFALNVPLSASSSASNFDNMELPPLSGIAGLEARTGILYAAVQFVFDFGETTVTLNNGQEGAFNRSSIDVAIGLKYFRPFRR